MFNGTPNGTRTRITGLRGQPPIPVRGWEHMYLKEFAVPLPFCAILPTDLPLLIDQYSGYFCL